MEHNKIMANPGPLGLLGFGMTTVLLNLHNAGFLPLSIVIVAMGIAMGGLAQIIAGIRELCQGNTFAGTNITCNAYMTPPQIATFCSLDAAGEKMMKNAFERMGLTARSHDRILRVARTIADLDGSENIEAMHLAEAIQYRNTDILKG
jgi:hypothetical protein